MSFAKNQVCIFSTSQEHEAHLMLDKLHDANIDVILLNKKDSAYGVFGQIELYVPFTQAEKAKILIQKLSE